MVVRKLSIEDSQMKKGKIVLYANQNVIRTKQKVYDLQSFDYNKESLMKLVKFFRKEELENVFLEVEDYSSEENTVVLLALTLLGNKFYQCGNLFELSFAYAVPLYKDNYLMTFVIENLSDCIKTHNIVFLKSDTLYICQKVERTVYEKISKKNVKTIERNENVVIEEVPFSFDFFAFWEDYDYIRFKEKQSDEFKRFFSKVYNSSKSFRLYRYSIDGKPFAYNVLYFSQNQKIIYDVLFPWIKCNSVYRIGIYSIIKNIQMAAERNWGYSICYGQFEYKDQIWKYLQEDINSKYNCNT